MPDLTIINNLKEPIHVAFYIGTPTHWKNNLQPNERWTTHLPTMPLYFQARWAERTDHDSGTVYRSREFSAAESWETAGTITAACAAGTASVVTAITCTVVGMGALGGTLAAPMMMAASAGGTRYATMNNDARLCETRVWVPWFDHKEYSVRNFEGGRHVLWDVKDDRQA